MMSGDIIRPVEVQRDETGTLILEPEDETGTLDCFTHDALTELHVRRLGHVLFVGNGKIPLHTALVHITSPNDAHYEALIAEAGPDGVVHHPV